MNIMLFTDVPPCKNFTWGIVLNIMCDFLIEAGHIVSCFAVKQAAVDAIIPEDKIDKIKIEIVEKPRENWGKIPNFSKCASLIGDSYVRFTKLPSIAKRAADFAKKNNADLIWSSVHGQTLIRLTQSISKRANIPYIMQIGDPPEWMLLENKVDRYTQKAILKEFGNTVRNSKYFIAASWAMADEYKLLYKCPRSIPVILGFSPEKPVPKGNKNTSDFVIALSGQIYASEEFYSLIRALDSIGWAHSGKKIAVRLYGRYFNLYFSGTANVEIRGWMDQEELLSELCDADLLYCPYWFSSVYEKPCRLSFPSKLSTYLKVPVPILFHGPEYASPYIFLKDNNAAYLCTSIETDYISEQIKNIIDDPNKQDFIDNAYSAFLRYLTLDKMKENFLTAINTEQ